MDLILKKGWDYERGEKIENIIPSVLQCKEHLCSGLIKVIHFIQLVSVFQLVQSLAQRRGGGGKLSSVHYYIQACQMFTLLR